MNSNQWSDLWTRHLGFEYDPFAHLEASGDFRLSEYVVELESFRTAWLEAPGLIWAKAGGGKTTMRIHTARVAWFGLGNYHPFPIPYVLPIYSRPQPTPTLEVHLKGILRAAVSSLLIGLAFIPEIFLELSFATQRAVAELLYQFLPGSLFHYVAQLRKRGSARDLPPLLDRAYVLPDPPSPSSVFQLCQVLEDSAPDDLPPLRSLTTWWDTLISLLLGSLNFRSIFVLIDGIDGVPSSIPPHKELEWIASLLAVTPEWAVHKVFLKGFLPLELRPYLETQIEKIPTDLRQAELDWTDASLANMLSRRVFAATVGKYESLDAVSSPSLRDLETTIAKTALPLPREAIVFTRQLLQEYVRRVGARGGTLNEDDLSNATHHYFARQAHMMRPARASALAA